MTTGLPKLYDPRINGQPGRWMRFKARLSGPLDWTVTVTDAAGEGVAEKTGSGDRISWFWNSSEVRPGRYRWTMEADGVRPASGVLGASPAIAPPRPAARPPARPPVAADLWPQPRIVSPDGDGYADLLTVRYTLSEPAVVSAELKDESGLTVVSLAINVRQQAGAQTLPWAPDSLADGRYRLLLTARGDSGRTAKLVDELVVLRSLAWLRADPVNLSPNGDGVDDAITISFELRQAGVVAVEIRDHGYPLALVQVGWLEAGSNAAVWNGQPTPGTTIEPGAYTVWVTVSTEIGTVTQKAPITVMS